MGGSACRAARSSFTYASVMAVASCMKSPMPITASWSALYFVIASKLRFMYGA